MSGEWQKHSTQRSWLCATAVPMEPGEVPITPDGLRANEFYPTAGWPSRSRSSGNPESTGCIRA